MSHTEAEAIEAGICPDCGGESHTRCSRAVDPMKRAFVIIRRGLSSHRPKGSEQNASTVPERDAIVQRCECGMAVLDHETHRAEAIAKLLADEGLIDG